MGEIRPEMLFCLMLSYDFIFMGPLHCSHSRMSDIILTFAHMKIAIPTRDGMVDHHFGHCDHYTVVEVNDQNQVVSTSDLPSPEGCGCKSNIAYEMQSMGITIMLAGNIGLGAVNKLASCGIRVIKGCQGDVQQLVMDYLAGNVKDNPQVCDHHECHSHEPQPIKVDFSAIK